MWKLSFNIRIYKAVTKLLGGFKTTETYFSLFQKLGSPRSRCWQIQCLERALPFTDCGILTVTSLGERSEEAYKHYFVSVKSLSHVWLRLLQARILESAAIPFSRGSSQRMGQTWISCIAGRSFTIQFTREAPPF